MASLAHDLGTAAGERFLLLAAVGEVHAAYTRAIDAGDASGWAAVFHPDGVSAGPGRPTLRGRSELEAFVRQHHQPDVVHLTLNPVIDHVGADHLLVAARYVILRTVEDAWHVETSGVYADRLETWDGRLVLRERRATATPVNF